MSRYAPAKKNSSGSKLLLPGLLLAAVFAILTVVRGFQLQSSWQAAKPEMDILLPLWVMLTAVFLVIALWASLKNAATRFPALGWIFRIALIVFFGWIILSAVRQFNIMNIGSWLFCGVSFVGILGCVLWPLLRKFPATHVISSIFAFLYLIVGFVCLYLGLNMYFGAQGPAAPNGTPVLVLGSQVNGTKPNTDLQIRIDTAAAWLKKNPQSKAVACGGKGGGESISEAECIRRGLTAKGIDNSRILLDDKSINTEENIKNAAKLLKGAKSAAIVTDDYHTCRARLIAKNASLQSYPVPAKTPDSCRAVSIMREFLALPVQILNIHHLFV